MKKSSTKIRTCGYRNCTNSSRKRIALFRLPTDSRRPIWIKHACAIPTNNTVLCERHFLKSNLVQRSRIKKLTSSAIPLPFNDEVCKCNGIEMDHFCKTELACCKQNSTNKETINCDFPDDANVESLCKKKRHDTDGVRPGSSTRSPPALVLCTTERPITIDLDNLQFESEDTPDENSATPTNATFQPKSPTINTFLSPIVKIEETTQNVILKKCLTQKLKQRSEDVSTFLLSQLFHGDLPWSETEKCLYIKWYSASPAFYKLLLDTGFSCPAIASIKEWLPHFNLFVGKFSKTFYLNLI